MLSDEAAARAAGDRRPTAPRAVTTWWGLDPAPSASGRSWWAESPTIVHQPPAGDPLRAGPRCGECGEPVAWAGRRRRVGGWWLYPVRCACGADIIRSPWRLVVGGDAAWWAARGFAVP